MTTHSVNITTYQRGRQVAQYLEVYLSPMSLGAEAGGASFECILVEEPSPGDALDLLPHLFKPSTNLRFAHMPVNSGPRPMRDAGVKVAQGDWIWFLGEDDVLDPAHVTKLMTRLLSGGAIEA